MTRVLDIVTAVIRDEAGRMLLVRKRGTSTFMKPGGKRDSGEDDLTTLARELDEELGCRLVAAELLGHYAAPAANEAGRLSRIARSWSIQPFRAAAMIIAYSPDTWKA